MTNFLNACQTFCSQEFRIKTTYIETYIEILADTKKVDNYYLTTANR